VLVAESKKGTICSFEDASQLMLILQGVFRAERVLDFLARAYAFEW
jgi:hypothetical protein